MFCHNVHTHPTQTTFIHQPATFIQTNSSQMDAVSEVINAVNKPALTIIETRQICQQIKDLSVLNVDNQLRLGATCINFAFTSLLKYNLIDTDLTDEIRQTLTVGFIEVIVHLCRRVLLQKNSSCLDNIKMCFTHLGIIVSTARTYLTDPNIIHGCCALIMILASDSEINQVEFGHLNASTLIVDILSEHLSDQIVVEMACRAVRNLASCDVISSKLMDDGVGDILCRILEFHGASEVTESAMWAVVNLSYDEDIATVLGSQGCCSLIVNNYSVISHTVSGRMAFCWSIRNLTCSSMNLSVLVDSCICSVLVNMIITHSDDLELLQSSIWCINNLSCHRDMRQALHKLNSPEFLIGICGSLIESQTDDIVVGPVAEAAAFALRGLAAPSGVCGDDLTTQSVQNQNQIVLGSQGACKLVCNFLRRFVEREAMAESCCSTLAVLCRGCSANQDLVGLSDGVSVLLLALSCHESVLETVEIGLKCLLDVVTNHSMNLQTFVAQSGVPLVVHYMKLHRTDYDICTVCCDLLLQSHFTSSQERKTLSDLKQLSDDGLRARPAGRFEDIAMAWRIEEIVN